MKEKMRQQSRKIALIYPPHEIDSLMFSLAYLSGYLRPLESSWSIKIIDCPANNYNYDDLRALLTEFKPDIIGVSIPFSNMLSSALKCMKIVRTVVPKAWIIAGGTHATLCPEDVASACDIVVRGAGEKTMEQIIKSFPQKEKALSLSNITFVEGSSLRVNDTEPFDKMLSPDWSGVDFRKYLEPIIYGSANKGISILGSRGCPYNCTFCSNGILSSRKVIYRDLEDVFKEIKWLMEEYGIRSFGVMDEVFNLNQDRVVEFCERIKQENINIEWSFQTRCDLVKNKKLFAMMAEAGAKAVSLGIESGNDSILKANKNISKEKISNAVKFVKDAGFLVYAGFIIGFPQDTIETVWETILYPDELDIDSPGFQIMVPYPKTQVRYLAEKDGGITTKDFDYYTTYGVVYVPPGLKEYDLLAIRKFAFQFFHTRTEKRLKNWLSRFINLPDYEQIAEKYWSLFENKDTLNFDYLRQLRIKTRSENDVKIERLPI